MGKVKIKKKETRIDMTAMSDVTVLLLTFFMLTSTFLQKEPVQVITPPSVAEEKVPVSNLLSVLVSPEGKIFLEILGSQDSTDNKRKGSENVRASMLQYVAEQYNALHSGANISFTKEELATFSKLNAFGVPITFMKKWLNMETEERDKVLQQENAGIPYDMNEDPDRPNEFQLWVKAAYNNAIDDELKAAMVKGTGIAIKADQSTPYSVVSVVMDNLQTIKMNKFTLMTALKTEEE